MVRPHTVCFYEAQIIFFSWAKTVLNCNFPNVFDVSNLNVIETKIQKVRTNSQNYERAFHFPPLQHSKCSPSRLPLPCSFWSFFVSSSPSKANPQTSRQTSSITPKLRTSMTASMCADRSGRKVDAYFQRWGQTNKNVLFWTYSILYSCAFSKGLRLVQIRNVILLWIKNVVRSAHKNVKSCPFSRRPIV